MLKKLFSILLLLGLVYYFFIFKSQNVDTPEIIATPVAIQITPQPTQTIVSDIKKVIRVIDGDTIIVEGDKKIRYIGMDTPEKDKCYFQEASDANKRLVEGKTVTLQYDVTRLDKYGRTLAYVYIDKIFVNEQLVIDGFAKVETVPPDIKYSKEFIDEEKLARTQNKGLWNQASCM